jgi:PleD family two-component response regulator
LATADAADVQRTVAGAMIRLCSPFVRVNATIPAFLMPNTDVILVVDDQREAREMLTEYLAFCGFVVQSAADGLEAVDLAVRVHPRVSLA